MGGSGSGGYTPVSYSGNCAALTFQAQLNSPQPGVLKDLRPGMILSVELTPLPKQIVQVLHGKLLAGALTGPQSAQLINCLQNGFPFQAEVISVRGGMCTVSVSPA